MTNFEQSPSSRSTPFHRTSPHALLRAAPLLSTPVGFSPPQWRQWPALSHCITSHHIISPPFIYRSWKEFLSIPTDWYKSPPLVYRHVMSYPALLSRFSTPVPSIPYAKDMVTETTKCTCKSPLFIFENGSFQTHQFNSIKPSFIFYFLSECRSPSRYRIIPSPQLA